MHPFLTNYVRRRIVAAVEEIDPYFNNVTLLIPCNGVDASTTITDVKGHAITAAGNVQLDTDQFKFDGASAYFDGTGDYLEIADSSEWALSGDFTIEMWIRPTRVDRICGLISASNSTSPILGIYYGVNGYGVLYTAQFGTIYGATIITTNVWHHVALVRSNGYVALFLDGVLNNQSAAATTTSYDPVGLRLGYGTNWYTGHIDNIRITLGVARYFQDFTVPATAFPTIADYVDYDPSYGFVTALLHCDGVDGSTDFIDVIGNVTVASGNAQINTIQSKFGGTSAYFDGTGDYVTITNDGAFDWAGSFTIEAWIYIPSTTGAFRCVFGSTSTSTPLLGIDASGYLSTQITGSFLAGTTLVTADTWHHVALCRFGTSYCATFLDGVIQRTFTHATATSFAGLRIGITSTSYPFTGWIDEVRVTSGMGRYALGFNPPTVPFLELGPRDSNCDAALAQIVTAAVDDTHANTYDLKGATLSPKAPSDTTHRMYGASSLYFSSWSELYIDLPLATRFINNWCIEFWVRPGTTNSIGFFNLEDLSNNFLKIFGAGGSSVSLSIGKYSGPSNTVSGSVNLTTNAWSHIAGVCRNGSLSMYVNGVHGSVTALPEGWAGITIDVLRFHYQSSETVWIDEIRIFDGICPYDVTKLLVLPPYPLATRS